MRVFIVAGSPQAKRPDGLAPGPGDRVIAADSGAVHARAWGWPVHLLVGDLDSAPPAEVAALIAAGTPLLTAPAAKDETDLELALARAIEDLSGLGDLTGLEIILCAALGGRADHALANLLLLTRRELARLDVRIAEGGQTIRLLRGGSADSHAASSATEHENRGNWIRGFSRSGGQSEKPAEASSPEERATILRAVAHAGRAATADENVPQSAGLRLGRCPRQSGGLRYGAAHLALTGTQGDLLSLLPIGGDAVGVTTAGLAYPLRDETLYFGQARGVSNVFEGAEAEVWLREGMMLVIQTDERRKTDDGGRTTDERRGTNRINEQTD